MEASGKVREANDGGFEFTAPISMTKGGRDWLLLGI